jgi:acetolactate synthase I/II/III large subunit
MMMPRVVATAVEHNTPAVWILRNNYGIGTIRDLQRAYHDGRQISTSLVNQRTGKLWNLDCAPMAEATGGRGIRIEHPDQFGDAYREAIRSDAPTVLDFVINRDTGIPITGTWQAPPIPEVQPTFGSGR